MFGPARGPAAAARITLNAVPGMNSGLSPADPTLVAAFRSALLHQAAIALLIVVFLGLAWATARVRRHPAPAARPERGADREARGRRLLRTGFGLLWILDGLAGQWSWLTTLPALAASAPGRECGLVAVNAVTFGPNNVPMTAGSCVRRGVAGRALPALPAGTATLAPGFGSTAYDALAVAGSRLTVWRLTAGAWAQVQVIDVPITYGSSG